MIEITETDSGLSILLKVQPNSKKNALIGKYGKRLKVSVTSPQEKGKANKAVIKLIASVLGVKTSQISIMSGQTTREKKIHISGMTLNYFEQFKLAD